MKKPFKFFLSMLLFASLLASVFAAHYYYGFHQQKLLVGKEVTIQIEPGMSFSYLVRQLHMQNIVAHPSYWLLYARAQGWDQKLPVGEHRIPPMTVRPIELMERIIGRDFLPSHRFTLTEGWNLRQTLTAMQEHPFISLSSTETDGLLAQREKSGRYKEGWLFPDTYLFKGTVDGGLLLQRAQKAMEEKLAALWSSRAADLPYQSAYEALILASIVEKEAQLDSERAKIAGVFVERLRRKMRLQADPTVIYGIKNFNGNITRKDLETDTAYNTYTRKGLPPTPIAMPGEASLQAAVHPSTEGKFLYFVSKKDGSHYFSKTYREHKKAVDHYQLGLPNRLR